MNIQDLNPEQQRAAQHSTGPILILAGAGSGKTRVLTNRVIYLISQCKVRPDRILAVTFTNKATNEMRERLHLMLEEHEGLQELDRLQGSRPDELRHGDGQFSMQGERKKRMPWIATFHSACLRILRQHAHEFGFQRDFAVYDTQDSKGIMKEVLAELSLPDAEPQDYLRVIDKAKNNGMNAEEFSSKNAFLGIPHEAEVYLAFQRKLLQSNAMDYGDLLLFTLELFRKNKEVLGLYQNYLEHVLVDEFQDTNLVQYEIVRLLTAKKRNLLVVGDDDQSIYAFRGASIANILEFEKDFPDATVIKLEQNYRSTQTILEAGHAVVSKNRSRREKKLWTSNPQGERIVGYCGMDEEAEASFVAREIARLKRLGVDYEDCAVFYRTNAQSRALEEALMDAGIPYAIYGGLKFYDRKEIKDLISYLRVIANPADTQAFFRIVNTPTRGIGAQSLQSIVHESVVNEISLFESAKRHASKSKSIAQFVVLMDSLFEKKEKVSLGELLSEILSKTSYLEKLQASKDPSALSRIENIRELQGLAESFSLLGLPRQDQLREFLDRASLTTSDENADGGGGGVEKTKVSLMTLHLAKGLEFPVVFLTGCEEGLLPHYRSKEEGTVDEERRLCYVGITRARKKLFLTRTQMRSMFSAAGSFGSEGRFRKPSQFIFDIPKNLLDADERFFADSGSEDSQFGGDDDEGENSFAYGNGSWRSRQQGRWKKKAQDESSLRKVPPLRKVQGIHTSGIAHSGKILGDKNPLTGLPGLLSAEKLLQAKEQRKAGRPASLEELVEGLQVIHPSFGDGKIQEVEHMHTAPERSKVTVYFPALQASKRLVYKYAQLSLPE